MGATPCVIPYKKHDSSLQHKNKARLKFLRSRNGQKMVAIARRVGFKWGVGEWGCFDFSVGHGCGDDVFDFAHEIAHWVVAAPERKMMPEFGFELLSEQDSIEEENLASLLGISYLLRIGCVVEAEGVILSHRWCDIEIDELEWTLFTLRKKRLISRSGAMRLLRAWKYVSSEYTPGRKIEKHLRIWREIL